MADNDTSANSPHLFIEFVGDTAMDIIAWILFVLTLTAVIYGVTSWCIINKFRHYRNYVLLSVIIVNMLRLLVYNLFMILPDEALARYAVLRVLPIFLLMFFYLSYHCWLLVLCYIFYVDFVKVFNFDVPRRYLKSTIFSWVVPFITVSLYYLVGWLLYLHDSRDIITIPIILSMLLIPLVFNFVIYITVVYALFRSNHSGVIISNSKWRRFYICTLIFVFSNILVIAALLEILEISTLFIAVIAELGEYLNTIALSIYIVIVKSNREIWRDFLNRRKSKQISLEMK